MKRYLLFMFDQYYPTGGWNDFRGSFDSIEAATAAVAEAQYCDFWQVVDSQTGEMVATDP